MKTSYHNHTPLCRHATGEPAEYLEAAYRSGCEIFGFSDHTPIPFENRVLAGCRMQTEEIDRYLKTLLSLRKEYEGRLAVRIGFETEYFPSRFDETLALYRDMPLDYIILGQHWIGEPEEGKMINCFEEQDDPARLRLFADTVCEAIGTGRFSIVAHPDVFRFTGDADLYQEEMNRIILAAKAKDIPLEINLYGLVDHRHYPNGIFWDEVAKLGAKVILGRDAHSTARVGNDAEIADAMIFVKEHKLGDLLVEDAKLIAPNL